MYNVRLGNCCQYCRQIGFLRPNSSRHFSPNHLVGVAPRAGFEPATNRLTAGCSTTELPGNKPVLRRRGYNKARRLCKGRGSANSVVCPPPPRHGRNLREPRLACQPKRRRREGWRPRPELNRGTRICSPLRHHSATWPRHRYIGRVGGRQHDANAPECLPFGGRCRKSCRFRTIEDPA